MKSPFMKTTMPEENVCTHAYGSEIRAYHIPTCTHDIVRTCAGLHMIRIIKV